MKKLVLASLFIALSAPGYSQFGIHKVKDICTGSCDSNPEKMYAYEGKVYFKATNTAGAVYVTNSQIMNATVAGSNIINYGFTGYNGKVYYYGGDQASKGLYQSDGTNTAPGTALIKAFDDMGEMVVYNNRLFFAAATNGDNELWVSNGTDVTTVQVKNIDAAGSSNPHSFKVVGNKLFFVASTLADEELWMTDGSETGTVQVKNISIAGYSMPDELTEFNGKLYFTANDGSTGRELWVSDGTESGTLPVVDIDPSGSSQPAVLTVCNGRLFFTAKTNAEGRELWVSDGTQSGTHLVKDIDPTTAATGSSEMVATTTKVYFPQVDASGTVRLWSSDGSNAGTQMVSSACTNPANLTAIGDYVFFSAESPDASSPTGVTSQLWRTDGTAAGTIMITPASSPYNAVQSTAIAAVGTTIVYRAAYDADGKELWKVDLFSTGLNETEQTNKVLIYPNPATDVLHIKIDNYSKATVNIRSVTGQVILSQSISGTNNQIDISKLTSGIYFAHIVGEGVSLTQKFIKN